jgi:hypothetical protein
MYQAYCTEMQHMYYRMMSVPEPVAHFSSEDDQTTLLFGGPFWSLLLLLIIITKLGQGR